MQEIIHQDLDSTDTDVAVKAMKDLGDILSAFSDNMLPERQDYLFLLGGQALIVGAMRHVHPNLKAFQCAGSRALMYAAHENAEGKYRVAAVGGFYAILAAMEKYHSDADIQTAGIEALCTLLDSCEANVDLFVADNDGIPFLLQRMESFPNNIELIKGACDLLATVSLYDKFQETLLDANAGSTLMHAFEHYYDNRTIRKSASIALLNVTKKPNPNPQMPGDE